MWGFVARNYAERLKRYIGLIKKRNVMLVQYGDHAEPAVPREAKGREVMYQLQSEFKESPLRIGSEKTISL